MTPLIYLNLNDYLIASFYKKHILLTLQPCFFMQKMFFNVKREGFWTLFASFTLAQKHQSWPVMSGWCNYMDKNHPGGRDSSFVEAKSRLLIKSRQGGTTSFLHVIRNVFFDRKDYLNKISSKYPVPPKQDKFSHSYNQPLSWSYQQYL